MSRGLVSTAASSNCVEGWDVRTEESGDWSWCQVFWQQRICFYFIQQPICYCLSKLFITLLSNCCTICRWYWLLIYLLYNNHSAPPRPWSLCSSCWTSEACCSSVLQFWHRCFYTTNNIRRRHLLRNWDAWCINCQCRSLQKSIPIFGRDCVSQPLNDMILMIDS